MPHFPWWFSLQDEVPILTSEQSLVPSVSSLFYVAENRGVELSLISTQALSPQEGDQLFQFAQE